MISRHAAIDAYADAADDISLYRFSLIDADVIFFFFFFFFSSSHGLTRHTILFRRRRFIAISLLRRYALRAIADFHATSFRLPIFYARDAESHAIVICRY